MSSLIDLFKEALFYPTKDYKALLIFGLIFIIADLQSIFRSWHINVNPSMIAICGFITFIFYFVIQGYLLSALRETINSSDEIPSLSILSNFMDGLQLLVVKIVYYILPTIFVLFVGWASGTFSSLMKIVRLVGRDVVNTTVNATAMAHSVPHEYYVALFNGLMITGAVAFILYILFELLTEIAKCRLAKYNEMGEALKIKEVFADIKTIGVGRFIVWYLALVIITLLFAFIIRFVSAIPYVGILIAFLIGTPFIALFGARALGNLYNNVDKDVWLKFSIIWNNYFLIIFFLFFYFHSFWILFPDLKSLTMLHFIYLKLDKY